MKEFKIGCRLSVPLCLEERAVIALLKLFTWGMELLAALIAHKLNLSRKAKWMLRCLSLLCENIRDAANLEDHLLVWNVIFKKLEKCFCLDQLGSTQTLWEVTSAVGHCSSKDSFQTQVTGGQNLSSAAFKRKIHVSTINTAWKDNILMSTSKWQRIVKAKFLKEKRFVISALDFGSLSQHYLIMSLAHFGFNNYINI